MTTVAIIPARYGSIRFPAKPLAKETGKFLIQHVFERVRAARRIERVIVATDDERIASAVNSFGGEAKLTRPDHASGTDRIGEVAESLGLKDDDIVLNVQGDEPDMSPITVDQVVESLQESGHECHISTAAARFPEDAPRSGPGSPLDPNMVKVVVDERGRAMYFSRGVIPFRRESNGSIDRPMRWLLHLGIYGFFASALRVISADRGKRPSALEETESLEQLRWLERGWPIAVVIVEHAGTGIDTPEQYAAFVRRYRAGKEVERS